MEKSRILDRHFLRATGKPNPRVCFLGTASGDAESARYKFYEAMATLACRPTHLSLIQPPTAGPRGFVLEQDAIYVGGGNTARSRAVARVGARHALRAAYERGVVLGGISAGMICWFEYGITDSSPRPAPPRSLPRLAPRVRVPALRRRDRAPAGFPSPARRGRIPPGYAADDGAALHFVDESWPKWSSRSRARLLIVSRSRTARRSRRRFPRDCSAPLERLPVDLAGAGLGSSGRYTISRGYL